MSAQHFLMVISPAKTLDFTSPLPTTRHTQPQFLPQSRQLIDLLRQQTPAQISALMGISDELAALNVSRYQSWQTPFTPDNSRPALLAFMGDVYEGLNAASMSEKGFDYLERHLRILSGLYGVLKPFDLMQPYRLEMGKPLANAAGRNLYAFWGDTLTQTLNAEQPAVLVNLASDEYFKSVKPKALACPVITPVFEDYKGGRYKIISFYAKRARGLMVRYATQHHIADVNKLKHFDLEGYAFVPDESDALRWVFRRKIAA
ncbi:peroxide stress protein YaaA [Amantichitinum ursilacus]|uniref:UPF0246 protein WG78_05245 n=1 Tax=Amantichitinum ursilacus TaxID=857265 RepID=A0A0N0XLF5_9NEIS|nr:peroxide stress protein YaaA [Amantichitinum ursilacus]KPC54028.1 hypothetical protein WG78_05245 [Amantichitinum ursilacus]